VFKRMLVLAGAAAAAIAIQKKVRDQRAEQELWAEATDDVRSTTTPTPTPPKPSTAS
jgi:hypothetical protein